MDLATVNEQISQRQKLAEAIAELSNLAQPSRAVDTIVALALPRWTYGDRPCVFYNAGPYYEGGPDRIGLRFTDEEGGQTLPGQAADMLVPRFTESYDAAFRLAYAEPNRRAECGTYGDGTVWAYTHLGQPVEVVGEADGCPNEPTALTLAFLRCHAARLEAQQAEAGE